MVFVILFFFFTTGINKTYQILALNINFIRYNYHKLLRLHPSFQKSLLNSWYIPLKRTFYSITYGWQLTLRDCLWRNTPCINCCPSIGSPLVLMQGRMKPNLCQYPLGETIKVRSCNYQQETKRWVTPITGGVRSSKDLTTTTNARKAVCIHILLYLNLANRGESFTNTAGQLFYFRAEL